MNWISFLTPENITIAFGAGGAIIALAFIGLLWWQQQSIKQAISNIFSQGGLFYFGMGLFMFASIVEAGPVIDQVIMHGSLWGYGGYVIVFAFDTVSAVSLRARLNARRVFDSRGMDVQMWGIIVPALVSISANLAGAIQHFNPENFSHLSFVAWLLPLIGAVFPSMIVVLSFAADHIIDTTAVDTKMDVEVFKAQEKKRIEILKVRLSTEQELLAEEEKIAKIRAGRDAANGIVKPQREWVWMKWLRPEFISAKNMKAEFEKATNQLQESQAAQIETLQTSWQKQLEQMLLKQAELHHQQIQSLTGQFQEQLQNQADAFQFQLHEYSGQIQQQFQNQADTFEFQFQNQQGLVGQLKQEMKRIEATPRQQMKGDTGKQLKVKPVSKSEKSVSTGDSDAMKLGKKERAFIFMARFQNEHDGEIPTIPQIIDETGCSTGSASNWRTEYAQQQKKQEPNGHHTDDLKLDQLVPVS